jgi:hypothetical protein
VAGVKIGSVRRSDSTSPSVSRMPQTVPASRYSFHPDPARYPRATHSMGIISARRTYMVRPANSSRCSENGSGISATSSVTRWLVTRSAVRANQNSERPVRTRPLSGIGLGSTTSKAEMRSLVTITRCS